MVSAYLAERLPLWVEEARTREARHEAHARLTNARLERVIQFGARVWKHHVRVEQEHLRALILTFFFEDGTCPVGARVCERYARDDDATFFESGTWRALEQYEARIGEYYLEWKCAGFTTECVDGQVIHRERRVYVTWWVCPLCTCDCFSPAEVIHHKCGDLS